MLELKEWVKENRFADKPWLVLGKGPTFSNRVDARLTSFNKFSLNHVVREEKVEIAHIIDIDVAEACADSLIDNCQWLMMPRIPNVRHFPGEFLTLTDWCQCIPALAEANRRNKLITYDFAHLESPDEWTIVARYFSSEIALGILGRMGVRKIVSLGIDGGTNYSQSFADLQKETLLANGQPSFDLQFSRLFDLANELGIEYKPLVTPSSVAEERSAQQAGEAHQNIRYARSVENQQALDNPILPEYAPINLTQSQISMPAKVQSMEQEIRELRANFFATTKNLQATAKELGIVSDRLGWARDEIDEYRAHVLDLERNMHTIVQSKTWKLGRVFTKPAEVLTKRLHKN